MAVSSVQAETFYSIQPASLDQPRINAFVRLPGSTDPLEFDGIFNIQAFFDTGASGVLISAGTAELLGLPTLTYTDPITSEIKPVIFSDVGVGGTSDFHVSQPVEIGLAPFHPNVSDEPPAGVNLMDYFSVHSTPIRTQIGPVGVEIENPLLENLDVFGVPLMRGKVVVMDPKPVDGFVDTMRTYVYDRATGQSGAVEELGPGIPTTSRNVKLSMASFAEFTQTEPAGPQYMPTLADNPFIGPNPLVPGDTSAPPTVLSYNGLDVPASLLLDTGAAASIISTALAEQLGITYKEGLPADSPELEGVPLSEQFSFTVGGIGGTKKMVGFYLDGLRLPTLEATAANDPTLNIDFAGAPVLVGDITVMNPTTGQPFTLDGIFGMNFLVASAYVIEGNEGEFPVIGALQTGAFEMITYDHDAGILGLEPKSFVLEPGTITWKGDIYDALDGSPSIWSIDSAWNFGYGSETVTYIDGDRVIFGDDFFTTYNAHVWIDEPVAPGAVVFANDTELFGTFLDYIIEGEAIRGYTGVTKTGRGSVEFRNSNTFTGVFDIQGGTIVLSAPQSIGPVNVRSATLQMHTSQRFAELNIGSGGTASFMGTDPPLLVIDNLTITGNGSLDLLNGGLVIEAHTPALASSIADRVEDYILAGQAGNAGLYSSTQAGEGMILALLPLSQAKPAALASLFGPDWLADIDTLHSSPLVAVMARFGDLDLNGTFDGDDYYFMDRGFATGSTHYAGGDLNFDNIVDGRDFFMMDMLYFNQLTAPVAPAASVPEPASLLLGALPALLLMRRRRRT